MTIPTRPNHRTGERPLDAYAADWEANARADACFAILSDPDHNDGAWDTEAFLATGEREIADFFAELDRRGIRPWRTTRALDFGCGVGRLTAALGRRFDEAVGVDVAPTMVERATALHEGGNCTFVLNQRDDLAVFETGSFDFAYSNIVLQHVAPALQRAYVAELVRVLAPSGIAAFGLPSRRAGLKGAVRRALPPAVGHRVRSLLRPPATLRRDDYVIRMEMNCLPEREVRALVAAAGGVIEDVLYTNAAEPDFGGRFVFLDRDAAERRARGGGYVTPHYVVRRA